MINHIFGVAEEKTIAQAEAVAQYAEHVALMADNHLGYIMPIGGVAAFKDKVSVVGVGFDIACGNLAIRTSLHAEDLYDVHDHDGKVVSPRHILNEVADDIANTLSFGIGRTNVADDAPVDHALFNSPAWYALPDDIREPLRDKARAQLGTIGSGNHYVDIFADEQDAIWIGVHFGSRGLGHTIASGFLSLAQNQAWGARVPERETLLPLYSELGMRYWALMELAGEYAYVGREWVTHKVLKLLGDYHATDVVHNHHNFAWKETHYDRATDSHRQLVVVRKGATPARPGQRGFIGGSMGDNAYITEGATSGDPLTIELQEAALYSTVHGAGRVMSRSAAKGSRPKLNKLTGERIQKKTGAITRQMMSEWTKEKGVIVRGGDVDESPHVYRRLNEVLAAQGPTINILHTLRPLIVVMAGASTVDPYRD